MSTPLGLLAVGFGIALMWLIVAGYPLPWENKSNVTQGTSSGHSGSGSGGGVSGVAQQQGLTTPASQSPQIQAFFPLPQ